MIVIHYHGIFQEGSSWDDGPGGVTQCSTAPGIFSMSQIKQERFGTIRFIVVQQRHLHLQLFKVAQYCDTSPRSARRVWPHWSS